MALAIGPGIDQWIRDHQATPLSDEEYLPPNYNQSSVSILIGDASGQTVINLVGYDKTTGLIIPPGPGVVQPTPPTPPSGIRYGFDLAYPQGQDLNAVIKSLGATWTLVYIGGPNYIGNWNPAEVQAIQGSLTDGFLLCYVGANVIDGTLRAGPLQADNGAGHGADAVTQAQNYGFGDPKAAITIFLDVERATWESDNEGTLAYCTGFLQGAYDAAQWAGIAVIAGFYGCKEHLDAQRAKDPSAAYYLAAWDGSPLTGGYDVHQYKGSTTVDGVQVDLDVAMLQNDNIEFCKAAPTTTTDSVPQPATTTTDVSPANGTDQPHVVTGPDDGAIEKANYQGTDETCGERVVAMAAAEDNIIPIDSATDQAFAAELLNQLGPGLDPNTFGGTNLDQQLGLLQYVARKFGKSLQVTGVNSAAGLEDPTYQHKSIACNLGPMLGPEFAASNHFLLQRKIDGDIGDGYVKVIDSDQALDYSNDVFTEAQVIEGAAALFGTGQQFGWAWNWL